MANPLSSTPQKGRRLGPKQHLALAALLVLGLISVLLVVWLGLLGGTELFAESSSASIAASSRNWQLVAFILIASVSLWLVIPSGSLLLIGAGFVFGAATATGLYYLLHCIFCWPVYQLARQGLVGSSAEGTTTPLEKYVPAHWVPTLVNLQNEPLLASLALRLIPVIPNAIACVTAPLLGIGFKPFFIATIVSCWVRPLFYASIGAGISELSELRNPEALVSQVDSLPMIGLGLSALALLLARLFILRKKEAR